MDICGQAQGSGFYTMNRWWETGKIREAIRDIETTEGGFAIEDKIGGMALQSRGYRASRAVSAKFTGVLPTAADEIKVSGRPNRQIAIKDVVNEVQGFVREFERKTAQTVLQREEAIAIALGKNVVLTSDYEGDGAVLSIDAPVASTDYFANGAADGSALDATSSLTVAVSLTAFNEVQRGVHLPGSRREPAQSDIYHVSQHQGNDPAALGP